jgi:HK97 gp10 family phage protein
MIKAEYEYVDNSEEISNKIKSAIKKALERIGMNAEGFAKKLCPKDTGALQNSINHKVSGNDAYIGTNKEYGAYVELGTGKEYPGGRQTPWVYKDEKGKWHMTHGQRAKPYLKPAAANHAQTYKNIVEDEMKNG